MTAQNRDEAFLEKVRRTLDTSVDNIDTGIQLRLGRIRKEVLWNEKHKKSRFRQRFLVPVTGVAAVLVALLASILYFDGPSRLQQIDYVEDVEMLASGDSLEFYANLDFYAWLAKEEQNVR